MSHAVEAGNRSSFLVKSDFIDDPDSDGAPEIRASWARLEIWVSGRNLTHGRFHEETSVNAAEVPVLPLVEWIVDKWDYILHEERMPTLSTASSSADWYAQVLERLPVDDRKMDAIMSVRERWWSTHGLGSALPDFRIPDLHIRRLGDSAELSWTDCDWRTLDDGVTLIEQPGHALVPVEEVAETLFKWCSAVVDQLASTRAAASAERLRTKLASLHDPDRVVKRLMRASGVDLTAVAKGIRRMAGVVGDDLSSTLCAILGISEKPSTPSLVAKLTVPVLLFRSASPNLSEQDLATLLSLCRAPATEQTALYETCREHATTTATPDMFTRDGLERALKFRDKLQLSRRAALVGDTDLETSILPLLGVSVVDVVLADPWISGVALAGPGVAARIAINTSDRGYSSGTRRRMTIAHELCHLLHDIDSRGSVGVVSNDWAPWGQERRANAFAAMLLAPEEALESILPPDSRTWTLELIKATMKELGIGVRMLTWHLFNLNWISNGEREYWLEQVIRS